MYFVHLHVSMRIACVNWVIHAIKSVLESLSAVGALFRRTSTANSMCAVATTLEQVCSWHYDNRWIQISQATLQNTGQCTDVLWFPISGQCKGSKQRWFATCRLWQWKMELYRIKTLAFASQFPLSSAKDWNWFRIRTRMHSTLYHARIWNKHQWSNQCSNDAAKLKIHPKKHKWKTPAQQINQHVYLSTNQSSSRGWQRMKWMFQLRANIWSFDVNWRSLIECGFPTRNINPRINKKFRLLCARCYNCIV